MSTDVVFISVSNMGCIDLTLNHLESIKRAGMTNYVAYAIDSLCYETLRSKGYTTHLLGRDDMNQYHDFNTPGFDHISFMRYHVIDKLLREGKTVWYLDVDTVVIQDLNAYIAVVKDTFDVALQDDCYMPCTGCMLFFPSALSLVKPMIETRDFSKNDQIYFLKFLNASKLRIGILNRNLFPNGLLYFNEHNPKHADKQLEFKNSDPTKVMFVHANWMIGVQTKIDAFKSKGLWFLS
uniref:Nucleotide-diphospho-sugar transferase domain-containing protein n=1 Tax=viral metagenome TaxID=1070528 RepID=A0A6C0HLV4_9ZZZZ